MKASDDCITEEHRDRLQGEEGTEVLPQEQRFQTSTANVDQH